MVRKKKTNIDLNLKDKAQKYFHFSLKIENHIVFKTTLDPFSICFSGYLKNLLKAQILTFFSMLERYSLCLSLSLPPHPL
jgi:hypothetical protein